MTAKQQLLEREAFSEEEAAETLRLLDQRADPVITAFSDAPEASYSAASRTVRAAGAAVVPPAP